MLYKERATFQEQVQAKINMNVLFYNEAIKDTPKYINIQGKWEICAYGQSFIFTKNMSYEEICEESRRFAIEMLKGTIKEIENVGNNREVK